MFKLKSFPWKSKVVQPRGNIKKQTKEVVKQGEIRT